MPSWLPAKMVTVKISDQQVCIINFIFINSLQASLSSLDCSIDSIPPLPPPLQFTSTTHRITNCQTGNTLTAQTSNLSLLRPVTLSLLSPATFSLLRPVTLSLLRLVTLTLLGPARLSLLGPVTLFLVISSRLH